MLPASHPIRSNTSSPGAFPNRRYLHMHQRRSWAWQPHKHWACRLGGLMPIIPVGAMLALKSPRACISRCVLGQGTLQGTASADPLERVSVLEQRSATPAAAAAAQAPMPSPLCGAAASHVAAAMPHLKNCNLLRHRKPTPQDSPLCCQAWVEQGSCGAVAAKCARRCVRFRRAWAPVASL